MHLTYNCVSWAFTCPKRLQGISWNWQYPFVPLILEFSCSYSCMNVRFNCLTTWLSLYTAGVRAAVLVQKLIMQWLFTCIHFILLLHHNITCPMGFEICPLLEYPLDQYTPAFSAKRRDRERGCEAKRAYTPTNFTNALAITRRLLRGFTPL